LTSDPVQPDRSGRDGGGDTFVPADAGARAFAVDPSHNVVLEASAGTGKTSVLVSRYLNLIRAGVDPSNILAITFTRKAAAEMRERIVRELRKAAALSQADASRWRELRDRLGDIAISTIDAFCLSLLREFPLEVDLDPGFEMADETEVLRLKDEALDRTLRIGRALAASDEHVAFVLARLGETRARAALESLLERRLVAVRGLARFLAPVPADLTSGTACARAAEGVRRALDLVPGGRERFLADGPAASARFVLLASDLAGPAGSGHPTSLRAALDRLAQHVFTQEGKPRQRFGSLYRKEDFPSEAARKRHLAGIPVIAPALEDVIARFDRDLNVLVARGIRRMLLVARTEYRRALDARAVVDFAEGLSRALRLLGRMGEFAQSRYRLEARYQHVLVDEFQDTSRAQWRLVADLVASWGEGAGLAQEGVIPPSIFIVGDRKQSIYGFRDAEVRVFGTAHRSIARLREDRDVHRALTHSFRAVPALQAFTNDLFASVEKAPGGGDVFRYGADDRFPERTESDEQRAGAVGLVVADGPRALAEAVADRIARILAGEIIRDRQTGVRRPAEPGDIAVLFRTRASHREVEQALTARRIPTYVYKGLGLFDADEIKDVVALLRYLADPWSDLRAAALLRSRIVRLSDAGIRLLAPALAASLLGSEPPLAAAGLDDEDRAVLLLARSSVARWIDLADRIPHAELLDRILAETAYAFETRGPRLRQTRENLKKMRSFVRRIQNRGYATLGRIAAHLDRLSAGDESNATIDAVDAVSLMTVHAAKGLEFPVVFVVNIERGSGGRPAPVVITYGGRPRRPLVSVDGMLDDADAAVRTRDREEAKRLLYVAVTRARDRLYLAAALADGRLRAGRGSLAELFPVSLTAAIVDAGARAADGRVTWTPADGRRHVLDVSTMPASVPPEIASPGEAREARAPDDFAAVSQTRGIGRTSVTRLAAPEREPAGGAGAARAERGRGSDAALAGTLVHRLFQFEPADWTRPRSIDEVVDQARRLCRADEMASADTPDTLLARAARAYLDLRERPDVRAVLTSGTCLFEVPFSLAEADAAAADRLLIVRGAIDCLVVRPDKRVVVLDFKTGSRREEHDLQLALYVRAARALVGAAEVDGLLIYADTT
jgi:ATP-dependent helicase/nuclease subunit A